MPALDTNLLVRWTMGDDEAQCARVRRLRDRQLDIGEPLFVPVTVLLELEWVLRSRYRVARENMTTIMGSLLALSELKFESEPAVEQALRRYRQSKADFADCLHAALAQAAGHEPLLSFDTEAARLPGVRLVGP